MKLLTVTVPCYNSAEYMEKCVASLLKGGDRVEIIIIDDGSKDATGEIADRLAAENPSIIKVVHQENGGHGEGINQGLKNATGKYFKTVDSDDALSGDFPAFLDKLENIDADLVVTNYRYVYDDPTKNHSICYDKIFKENKVLTWDETGKFGITQYLTIHSCTFRTETMRESGMVLPKHIFYEDNQMICTVLPKVRKIAYFNYDLYLYTIGREGQSMQEDIFIKRYNHQITVAINSFKACRLEELKKVSKKLYDILYHELYMLIGGSIIYARKNGSEQAKADLENMWKEMFASDEASAKKLRYHSSLKFIAPDNAFGRWMTKVAASLAHKKVGFN